MACIRVSSDRGRNWQFMSQMAIGQFYAIAADMQELFYNVYGGLQDNSSYGLSATRNSDGITMPTGSRPGRVLLAGRSHRRHDGAESQYGRLLRFDTRTGERRAIARAAGGRQAALELERAAPHLAARPQDAISAPACCSKRESR
jgi:hypothetical protein